MVRRSVVASLAPALAVLALAACDPAAEDLRAPTVAPGDPTAPGPYAVGVTTIVLPEVEGYRDVPVEVWYPAAEVGGATTTYDVFGVQLASTAHRDAPPDPTAPAFLVAFSHGLGGIRQQNYTMAERLASHGYVIVSADHPGTTTQDLVTAFGNLKEPLMRRPGTVVGAVDAVLGGGVPGLAPRDGGYAMVGHSLGALTAMFLGGAVVDLERYQTACASGQEAGACGLIGTLEGSQADLDRVHPPDPRIVTTVLQAPAGGFAMIPETVASLPAPFVQAGDRDALVAREGEVVVYDLLGPGAALALYTAAGHNAPTDICDIPLASALSPDCDVADGYADPGPLRQRTVEHVVAWLGVHLGGEPSFAEHLGPGEGYTWSEK